MTAERTLPPERSQFPWEEAVRILDQWTRDKDLCHDALVYAATRWPRCRSARLLPVFLWYALRRAMASRREKKQPVADSDLENTVVGTLCAREEPPWAEWREFVGTLTQCQRVVLRLSCRGWSMGRIARRLRVHRTTVCRILRRIEAAWIRYCEGRKP